MIPRRKDQNHIDCKTDTSPKTGLCYNMDGENTIYYDKLMDFIEHCKRENYYVDISLSQASANDKISKDIIESCKIIRCETDGNLYAYNKNGYYCMLYDWLLDAIIKKHCDKYCIVWNSSKNNDIKDRISVNITNFINSFNTKNELNFKNKIFNLEKGSHRYSINDNSFTCILDYDYNETAQSPLFLQFLNEITCGDESLQQVIQEIMGYCLSTDVKAEKAFFFYGRGKNGKSVLAKVIEALVGKENCSSISLTKMNEKFGAADFIGKRVNISAENENLPNTELLKSVVSGDLTNIQVKYKSDWKGSLFVKQIFLMNTLPKTKDLSNGYFRKILIVPFDYTIPDEKTDVDLVKKLLHPSSLSGIFNWAYEGYKRLVENNYVFTKCDRIERITRKYEMRENNAIYFFKDTYTNSDKNYLKSQVYKDYITWCKDNGFDELDRTAFWQNILSQHNAIKITVKRINGYEYIAGIDKK